jgi:hypothetical protein
MKNLVPDSSDPADASGSVFVLYDNHVSETSAVAVFCNGVIRVKGGKECRPFCEFRYQRHALRT